MHRANVGPVDRVVRFVVGAVLLTLGLLHEAVLAYFLVVVGGVLIVTALSGFCLVYGLMGIDTTGQPKDEPRHPAA